MAPGGVRPPRTSHAASQLSRTDLPKINKGGRGDALNAKLNDHIRKKKEKPTITIKSGNKIPTGDWATEFQTEIGIIVKKFSPWSTRPKWKSIGKSDLKKFHDLILYKQDGTERENPHHQVKQEDWEKLCTWFESDEFQCDPETVEVVEQIEFYKLTHCKNDVWTCHTAEENYGKMLELRDAPTPEGSTPLTDAQICEEVLGVRSGYVKGLGHGYEKPSSSSIEYNAELGEALRRADDAEKRNKELEERVDDQNRTIQGLVTDTMDIRRMLLEMQGNRQSTPENSQSTPENRQTTS
ncbi:hypothetical protein C5167_044345 [Papaver somniferum]|uniref:Transposase, Ptta/En/Spm, plant n=1 Tax=Papaver somniferum TaxID=3469 RepID=A0A4Y7L8E3_PAPSO|nr:hypothetical protein C5167_044345 [Papaver somniferum]